MMARTQTSFAMEPLPDLGGNLFAGHFINRFDLNDAVVEIALLQTFFQFVFRCPQAKDQRWTKPGTKKRRLKLFAQIALICSYQIARAGGEGCVAGMVAAGAA